LSLASDRLGPARHDLHHRPLRHALRRLHVNHGLPAGATIDYNYLSLNQIAIIVAAAVPEIALASAGSAFALIACSLALLERRGLRRRRPPA